MIRTILTLAALIVTMPALATDWVCNNGGDERVIGVQYEIPGQQVPCLVVYEKRTEGGTDYPWNAKGQVGFCEEKADYLKDRLEGFGWQCAASEE